MSQNSLIEAAEQAANKKTTAVATFTQTEDYFQKKWNMATAIATSALIPNTYRGKIADVMIAMELSEQMGMSLFTVTQNLDIIHGKTGWKSTFIIATINSCGRYSSKLQFEWKGKLGEAQWGCRAYVVQKDKSKLFGSWIDIHMATQEGWVDKKGSKWVTMPEQMLQYRAASFFGRLYVPDLLVGLQTIDEMIDVEPISKETIEKAEDLPTITVEAAVELKTKEIINDNKIIMEEAQQVKVTSKDEITNELNSEVSQDILIESKKELTEQLSFLGFKIMQIKENSKKQHWAKIIASSDEADFDLIIMINGMKKINPTDNFFVMDITKLK
ncbi:MAG: hypothetical protein DRG78_15680 [Epsilonproteobacteria bacterium]|nr:MAG: hypothetical protein DRG78_15680 [Campylobacterota bacterium]